MFKRADVFGNDHASEFAPTSEATTRFGNLKKIIKDLDIAKAGQGNEDVEARSVLMDGLRLDVQNIARTAAAIDQDEPGFAGKFPRPATGSDTDLLTAADKILAQLFVENTDSANVKAAKTALAAKFISKELDPNFVQNLQDDRAAIDDATHEFESSREGGVKNTAAIDRLIREGMKEINYLNAIVKNKYTRNPDKLRAWQSAIHIERAPQRAKTAAAPAAPVPAK